MFTLDVYFIYFEFFKVRRWLKFNLTKKWWLCCHNDFLVFKMMAWIHKIHIMCCWQFIVSNFSFINILNCSRYSMRSFMFEVYLFYLVTIVERFWYNVVPLCPVGTFLFESEYFQKLLKIKMLGRTRLVWVITR